MIIEACRLVDDKVDFSLYDDDGDGEVDNVFVFFAGGDEAEGAGDDCIWSHAWYLRDGAGKNVNLDGKVINRYACTAEMTRYQTSDGTIKQRLAGIGTFCHEYSHTFGLPDMYDTDYEGSGGESEALWGCTSLMDTGNQNNGGFTPPYFNAIEREILGMSEPELIDADGVYRLEPINESGRCYRINTDVEGEYYLLECRSDKGWDAHIGGSGLLVYHIDKVDRPAGYSDSYHMETTAALRWNLYNEVNCRPDHQCADLIEAVPGAENIRNVFFPLEGADAVDRMRMAYWSGDVSKMSLTGIRFDGEDIVFNVIGASAETTPPDPVSMSYEKFQDAAIVTFECSRIYSGDAYVSWGQTDRLTENVILSPYAEGKYALVLDGLVPRTSYTVSVLFKMGEVTGKTGTISFMTSSDTGGHPYIYLRYVKRNPDGSFPKDSRVPLRMYNAVGAEEIEWTFDGIPVKVDPDGYYKLEKSGTLKAVVHWEDGSRDIVVKEIKVAE
jgi:M6 family metalloprotease-like protein